MERKEILAKLEEIMSDLLDKEKITFTEETTAKDVVGWDSLTHISFVSAVEDEFNMTFKMKDVVGMKNVGGMIDVIMSRM